MRTKIIEAVGGNNFNWGKFMVLQWEREDWDHKSAVDTEHGPRSVLGSRGHSPRDLLVVDLETCEGAIFGPHGFARADLRKHQVWVCPVFPAFLGWLYEQVGAKAKAEERFDVMDLPDLVEFQSVPPAIAGHRREGPLDALLKKCLEGTDTDLKGLARTVWQGLHGADEPMPLGTPPTLADFQKWTDR